MNHSRIYSMNLFSSSLFFSWQMQLQTFFSEEIFQNFRQFLQDGFRKISKQGFRKLFKANLLNSSIASIKILPKVLLGNS